MLGNSSYIGRAQTLWSLLADKLDGLAFIQGLVTIRLDGGEMDEDVLSAGTLDEAESLGAVEPFHYALLFHVHSPSLIWSSTYRSLRSLA
jgi:hypothetical protein